MPSTQYYPNEDHNDDTMSQSDNGEGTQLSRDYNQIYYPSNVIGAFLRNAISGNMYPCRRGNALQLQYYQVVDARGFVDNDGRKRRLGADNDNGRDPNYLYYNSPEEYIQHCRDQPSMKRHMTVTPSQIENWNETQRRLFPRERNFVNDGAGAFTSGKFDMKEYERYINEKNTIIH